MTDQKAITKFEQTKALFRADETVKRFAEVLGNDRNARAYVSSALIAVANNEQLQECTSTSIMVSAMRAATLRLSVDPTLGQAHLVPYKGVATFVIGYKGLEQLALRTGKYRYINVATIWEGQTVVENQLKGIHSIQGLPTKREAIGYMLYFELYTGYAKTFYMTVDEIRAHAQRYSKTYKYESSPWKTEFDKMAKKTVLRLGLSTWGYFDPSDAAMMGATDEADTETVDAAWMERAVEQEENKPKKTAETLVDELTGEVTKPEVVTTKPAAAVQEAQALGGVVVEEAPAVTDSKGKAFADMTNAEIAGHMTEYAKRLKANPGDEVTLAKFAEAKFELSKRNEKA